MAALQFQDIADLVAGTLRDLGRMKFEQIAQDLVEYEVFTHWFKKNKVQFDGGNGIQRTLMNRLSRQAAHVGLLDTDSVDIPDLVTQMNVNYVHAQTHWGFIFQETLVNKGENLIFNVIEPRRADAMISLAEEIEDKAWASPNAANTTDPFGVPYWIVKNATTGFNGGLPSDHTTVGGVNLTTSPTFKNYTDTYTAVSKPDLIKKMRSVSRLTNFVSPIKSHDYSKSIGKRFRIYANEATVSDFEDVGEAQNENLGRDLAPMKVPTGSKDVRMDEGGALTFRGNPICYIPKLDDDSQNPVYMIDHGTFYPVCLKGDYLRESEPLRNPLNHNGMRVFVDLTYNFLCLNRRRNAVLYVNS